MAISIVNSTGAQTNNGGNATIALGTTVSDDCIIVAVTLGTSKTSTLSVTSSSGGAFTQIVSTIVSSQARFGVFRQIVSSASLITQAIVTGTAGTTDATSGVAHIFRGVSSGTPEDATSTSTTGNSSQPDSPSITPGSNANQGFLPYVCVTSVGMSLIATPTAPSSFLNAVTISGNDTIDATTGQAWITIRSTAAFDPAAWASSVSATAWCSATTLLRPDVVTWKGENESGTLALVDEQRKIVMTGYGVV